MKKKVKRYLTIIKEHKKANDKYGYIIYPNISLDDLLTRNDITIQKHEDNIHVIKDKNDVMAINVFEKGQYTFDGFEISDVITMMIKKDKGLIYVALSSPELKEITDQVKFKYKKVKEEMKNKTKNFIFKMM